MQTVDEVGVKYGDQLYVGIPTSPRSPLGGRTSLSLVTLVDLVQYLKKMPVEARTRSMLVDIEEAMDPDPDPDPYPYPYPDPIHNLCRR